MHVTIYNDTTILVDSQNIKQQIRFFRQTFNHVLDDHDLKVKS